MIPTTRIALITTLLKEKDKPGGEKSLVVVHRHWRLTHRVRLYFTYVLFGTYLLFGSQRDFLPDISETITTIAATNVLLQDEIELIYS